MADTGYEFFEHTADVGLRAFGSTLTDVMIHAAHGVVALLTDDSPVAVLEERPIALQADSRERLLMAWLQEIVVWCQTEHFLPAAYEIAVTETTLQGRVRGERFDSARHAFGTEVKGVTYHQLSIRQTASGLEARVILDV